MFGADAGTQHRIVLIPRLRPTPPNVRDVGVPLRVLVVDDEDLVRQELASLIRVMWFGLRSGAIEVRTAATPDEALREIQCDGADVVVLDVDLAGADGLALLPHVLPVARVLVWSGQCCDATRKRALALGADAFVDKGEPAQVLMAHLARLARPSV